jgi:hypothetical protein
MASRLTNITASNYACETALSKQSDSTTGISGVTNSTGSRTSAPYLVNGGSDAFPIVSGLTTFPNGLGETNFPDGINVPGGGNLTIAGAQPVTLTLNTSVSLLPYFPPNFNYACIVTLDPVDPSGAANSPYMVSSVGTVDISGGAGAVLGFGNSVIAGVAGQAGIGIVPTAGVTYSVIQANNGANDLLAGYFGTAGAPVPPTITVNVVIQTLASSIV